MDLCEDGHYHATAHAPEPQASVLPAPRSYSSIQISLFSCFVMLKILISWPNSAKRLGEQGVEMRMVHKN